MAILRLVTRADDAGLNRPTNRAIRASVKRGIVRNVSVMATTGDIEDAAASLGDLEGVVDFGFHVCLTSEWRDPRFRPLAEVRGLTRDDGTFAAMVEELATFAPDPNEVTAEVAAQYERLIDSGFTLSYLDEHMRIGEVAGIADVLTDFAKDHGLVYDRTLQNALVIQSLPDWEGPGPHPGTELADHLSEVPSGTYLIVGHPGFKSDDIVRLRLDSGAEDDFVLSRNRERRMFADIEIVDYCENARVKLLRYSEL